LSCQSLTPLFSLLILQPPPRPTLFPYTTLFRSIQENPDAEIWVKSHPDTAWEKDKRAGYYSHLESHGRVRILREPMNPYCVFDLDRKSTRLNSTHVKISYAVFCLKKKKNTKLNH